MLKRDALSVLLILLFATTFAGCTELVNIVNGRDAAATPLPGYMPLPTATIMPTQEPTLTPTATLTPTPTPTPSPSPVNNSTATPTPTPAPTPTPTPPPTPVPTPEPEAFQNDTRVTYGKNVQQPIGIWDHYIVYDEKVGDNQFFIHLYNINTDMEQTIATGNVRSYGCIGGEAGNGKIALIFNDANRFMLYDIKTESSERVTGGAILPYTSPCIDGLRLTYVNNDDPMKTAFINIYEFNTSTKSLNKRMEGPNPIDLDRSGDNVVWWYPFGDIAKVGLLRLTYDASFWTISPADILSDHPKVYANTVVYHCVENGAGYINYYDIPTKTTGRLTNAGSQSSCDIYGDRVVYDDNRDGNWNVYMTDRATGQETRLTNEPHDQTAPLIWGDHVAYIDNRNGSPDIYWLTIAA